MMTSRIKILKENTINQIAAGEVVENPASVVKELVENAIDAGSYEISVEIVGGGFQLIKISDDGIGMSSDDALMSLERHATSKITAVEDLASLTTMGFRGEALASISAISRMTVMTHLKDAPENSQGVKLECHGGKMMSLEPYARKPGTTIEVKSLFYTVPARKKFQKSPQISEAHISKALTLLALSHPHIAFKFFIEGELSWSVDVLQELSFLEQVKQRLEILFGKDFASELKSCEYIQNGIEVKGWIGHPMQHRQNKSGQYFFLNQRVIQSPLVSIGVKEGFSTMIPEKRYPVCVLYLNLPADSFDVNVHPQKKEVRFNQEYTVKHIVSQAVSLSLQSNMAFSSSLNLFETAPFSLDDFPFKSSPLDDFEVKTFYSQNAKESFNRQQTKNQEDFIEPMQFELQPKIVYLMGKYLLIDGKEPGYLGRYVTISQDPQLLALDLKAVSRLLFQSTLVEKDRAAELQSLMIPTVFECSSFEASFLQTHIHLIKQFGIELRAFGAAQYMIDALHPLIHEEEAAQWLHQVLDEMKGVKGESLIKQKLTAALLNKMKYAKRSFSLEEAQYMLKELSTFKEWMFCPLGEPLIAALSEENLGILFKK